MFMFGKIGTLVRAAAITSAGVAGAALVACGGGDDQQPVPTLAAPTGPTAAVVDASAPFSPPAAGSTEYQRHLALATANAGTAAAAADAVAAPGTASMYDPTALRHQWCFSAENTGLPPELADQTSTIPPTQMFDNIWAIGPRWVLQYAFKADNGKVFLIDTLNNTKEVQTLTEPGLIAMGSSASQLEGAMPTHGHGDHYGGAGYLQATYGIPIFLGSADAAVGPNPPAPQGGGTPPPPFVVTPLDSANLQPQERDFGGLPMTLLSTPGHTAGTFSGIVPAKLNGKQYNLAFWGGTAMPGTIALAKSYLDGSERLYRLGQAKKIDGTIHTHPFVDGSLAKLDALGKNRTQYATSNPFLIGNTLAQRSLSILRECAASKVAQLDATAKIPAWLTTTVKIAGTARPDGSAPTTAVVRDPFGFIQNGTVKFTMSPSGQTCTAATNAKGEAACVFPAQAPETTVTVEFAEATLADGAIELGSSATALLK